MRWQYSVAGVAALAASVSAQGAESSPTCASNGMCYSTHNSGQGVTYGIALPASATREAAYDVIIRIEARRDIGWAAISWGGSMTNCPLGVAWPNGDTVMIAAREAFGYYVPPPYDGSTYTILNGTGVNDTHWTLNALCSGCASWENLDGNLQVLDPAGLNYLAFAMSYNPVDEPNNVDTTFSIHALTGHWYHDFAMGASADFDSWIGDTAPPVSSAPATTTTRTTSPSSTFATVTTSSRTSAPTSVPPALPIPSSCNLTPRFPSRVASGWHVTKLLGNLTMPRDMVVDSLGNLLIAESGRGLTVHTFNANGCIASSRVLVSNRAFNHGIALSPDGKTLYASSLTTAWRWAYDASTQTVSGQETVLRGMNPGGHATRGMVVSPVHPELLVVQLGSSENFDMASLDPAVGRSIVKVFNMSAVPAGGYDYASRGWLLGYGLRNEIGLALDPEGNVWGVENSGDQFRRTPLNGGSAYDIHNDNPADELNFLGDPSKPNNNWYGYPTCFTAWDSSVITDVSLATGDQFIPAPNSSFTDATCEERSVPPRLSFQAHSAPIDAKFAPDFSNLYVTFHGSWNRDQGTGYKLVEIPFQEATSGAEKQWLGSGMAAPSIEPVAARNSRTGYRTIWEANNESTCSGNTCHRPSGIVWDLAGTRMFVASDNVVEGEVFVVWKGQG